MHRIDTRKQLLARSRDLLFTPQKWSESQKLRAKILFREYPDLKKGHSLTHSLRMIYKTRTVSRLGQGSRRLNDTTK